MITDPRNQKAPLSFWVTLRQRRRQLEQFEARCWEILSSNPEASDLGMLLRLVSGLVGASLHWKQKICSILSLVDVECITIRNGSGEMVFQILLQDSRGIADTFLLSSVCDWSYLGEASWLYLDAWTVCTSRMISRCSAMSGSERLSLAVAEVLGWWNDGVDKDIVESGLPWNSQ